MAASRFLSRHKVELHRHLEGAVRLSTVLDVARRHGVALPHGRNGELTESSRLTLEGIRPHIQTLEPFPNLETLLNIFDYTQSTFKSLDVFHRIAKEAVEDAYEEGVRCLELRYAPAFASMNHGHSWKDVLQSIQAGIADGVDATMGPDASPMGVGLICIGVGAMGDATMKNTTDFFLENLDSFCGFDMAGAEQNVADFESHFRRVQEAGASITCHASEDLLVGKPQNALTAVEALGARRIGHGIQIHRDQDVMRRIRDSGVLLEVSVTSNVLTSAVSSIEDHPVRKLWEYGIPVCPNTDDPGIMAIDINHEWDVWESRLGFSDQELDAMTIIALKHSFLPDNEKELLFSNFFADTAARMSQGVATANFDEAVAFAEALHKESVAGEST